MKVALVGCTGLVGTVMLKILEERDFPLSTLIPVASEKSIGKEILFKGKKFKVVSMEDAIREKPDIALFSAGGATSRTYAPRFAEAGTVVIDNSSAWRMDSSKKLVVPEVNAQVITASDKIIANPNCSTIQMVVALKPLHEHYKIKRIIVSTYQSVTGSGVKAVNQLSNERKGLEGAMAYAYPIDMNAIPQIGPFLENGYSEEEMKMILETKKIMNEEALRITATTVRIPVMGGHSESVNVEFERPFDLSELRQLLEKAAGVTVVDDPTNLKYPMPRDSQHKDDVFVGRLRRDDSCANSLNMWIVSDNLRKGAATNAVQIAEYLLASKLIVAHSA